MRLAFRLARQGYGHTSPNPMVGAVLVNRGYVIGRGWHRRAGEQHAEIQALADAQRRRRCPSGATLYVTLEPCCTTGRTPPCTDAIIRAGIRRVVAAATDPNPRHAGRGFDVLRLAGVAVEDGLLAEAAIRLNETFNYWIVQHMPFVTVKAAATLDGKIATEAGVSKWITGVRARQHALRLRLGMDAILVGVNTVLADDPSLTVRSRSSLLPTKPLRRLVLDARARTPLDSKVVSDAYAAWTTVFVSREAPARRREALARQVKVVVAPSIAKDRRIKAPARHRAERRTSQPKLDLDWILRRLGREGVTSLLVEGGGEVQASFFERGLVHRLAFYYAPIVLAEARGRRAVAGAGAAGWSTIARLQGIEWRRLGKDLFLTGRVSPQLHEDPDW